MSVKDNPDRLIVIIDVNHTGVLTVIDVTLKPHKLSLSQSCAVFTSFAKINYRPSYIKVRDTCCACLMTSKTLSHCSISIDLLPTSVL